MTTTIASTETVRARIDRQIKKDAEAALSAMGLTTSAAIRMMLTRVAIEKALPFEAVVPNATTVAALREADRGNLPAFQSMDDLMVDLFADD